MREILVDLGTADYYAVYQRYGSAWTAPEIARHFSILWRSKLWDDFDGWGHQGERSMDGLDECCMCDVSYVILQLIYALLQYVHISLTSSST